MLKIKEIRTKKNIPLSEIVAKTGISRRMLFDYENGNRDVMYSKLELIAEALGVSVAELSGHDPPSNMVSEPQAEYHLLIQTQQELVQTQKKLIEQLEENLKHYQQDQHNENPKNKNKKAS
jgi:transcriptional regulator with XRE-family HTH domain